MAPVLIEDILVKVLCWCDIATVLSVGLASRSCYALSTSKQVWLTLLSDLQRRGFVDHLPNQRLDEFATQELVDLAKRAVHGPETWSASHPSMPTITRQIVLRPNIRHGPGILNWENEPRLLPGGRFILFSQSGDIECRDTLEDKLIWTYKPRSLNDYVQNYAVEVFDGGQTAMILLGIRTYERHEDRKNFLEVVRLDLNIGSSTSQVFTAAPNTSHDNPFGRLSIQGDFAAASIPDQWVVIIQLSTGLCSVFTVPSDSFDIAFVPQHVVILKAGIPPCLRIWSTRALLGRDTNNSSIETIEPIVTITLPESDDPYASAHLGSNLSPLSDHSSTIWAIVSASSSTGSSLLYKYRISHPHLGSLSITPTLPPVQIAHPFTNRGVLHISFPGFMNVWKHILSPEGGMKVAELADSGDHVHMSAYSGALTYATWEKVVVNYYK